MSSNWYDAMPADYGDEEPEKASPEVEKVLKEAAASPSAKRGRPSKKAVEHLVEMLEDVQGTTAQD